MKTAPGQYTEGHTAFGPRACPFGAYAFADSSPWYKLWKSDGKVAFLGVDISLEELITSPEKWYSGEVLQWIERARS